MHVPFPRISMTPHWHGHLRYTPVFAVDQATYKYAVSQVATVVQYTRTALTGIKY
jgi:hypothetical protein